MDFLRPRWEVADVFRLYGQNYLSSQLLPAQVLKAIYDITACRTSELGGHTLTCNACGHQQMAYNSCRNRHCPKCQFLAKEQWIQDRKDELLPVPYFHLVFTLPAELNRLAMVFPKQIYNILFDAAWDTLKSLALDKSRLGANTGCIALLHTWGQNPLHPHLHCIVPAGGFCPLTQRWIFPKNQNFLFPVKVISTLFKGKFLSMLKGLIKTDTIHWNEMGFNQLLSRLYGKDWVVFSKKSFAGPHTVIDYLGRYTHRVAINNSRIKLIKDRKVYFQYKDYRNNCSKTMGLNADEFMHRFLLHILPKRFYKIRSFGILANKNKYQRLSQILLFFERRLKKKIKLNARVLIKTSLAIDLTICPVCGKETLKIATLTTPTRGSPA